MESIFAIVGFLGAGKTFLLKKLVTELLIKEWSPYIILNDYENASLDAQYFFKHLSVDQVSALSGSCICCSGIAELREQVNAIPQRENSITLIEANGTTDACSLMGFLGVGLSKRFLPPIQISVVDARNWQKRGRHNELEANQVQVSSLIVLNHVEQTNKDRVESVKKDIEHLNKSAIIIVMDDINANTLSELTPSNNNATKMVHAKSHWSSCSVDLPDPLLSRHLQMILDALPESVIRAKGCTKLDEDNYYSHFEMIPSGEVFVRPYAGELIAGPQLLVIGPGSDPDNLQRLIEKHQQM